MKFFTETQMVPVSCFNQEGRWMGNLSVHVAAGTSLPQGCTEAIFIPSDNTKSGLYDALTGSWSEDTGVPHWTIEGVKGEAPKPEGIIPDGAVGSPPPEYNPEKQVVLFKDGAWKVYDVHLGEKYWGEDLAERIVTEVYWECPDDCTLTPPPKTDLGFGLKLVAGEWKIVIDNRGTEYWTQDGIKHSISELNVPTPEDCLTSPPPSPFHRTHDGSAWILDLPLLATTRRQERDARLAGAYCPAIEQLTRWIDEAEDSPAALSDYKAQRSLWHAWADALCDLPGQPGWPWPDGEVPWPQQPQTPTRYTPTR